MTLAEQLVEHLRPKAGFGALFGYRIPLSKLLAPFLGRTIEVAAGISIRLPQRLNIKTRQLENGDVQLSFAGNDMPRITSAVPLEVVGADITRVALRQSAEALQVELGINHFPDFTLTIDLEH